MEPKKLRNFVKELFEAVSIGSVAKVKIIFANYVKTLENTCLKEKDGEICSLNDLENNNDEIHTLKYLVNCEDKHCRTLLHIAAKLGFDEICKLLIDNGADIDHTPLMLAAINNHSNVVRLLLKYDETVSHPDLVYEAANEAASVGHTEATSVIHTHMINRALDHFMKFQESGLCITLRNALRELLMQENRYPVRLILYLKENSIILENLSKSVIILRILREQQFEKAKNEKLSWECHEIAYTFGFAEHYINGWKAYDSTASNKYILDAFIKLWLKDQPKNDVSPTLAAHVEEISSSYPFKDSNIYRTMAVPVKSFYNKFTLSGTCETCRNGHDLKVCSGCRNIMYCSMTCQKLHWFVHKIECKKSCMNYQEMAKALETKLTLNN